MRRLMGKDELNELAPMPPSTRWRLMRDGLFPLSVRSGGKSFWYADEIQEWLENLPRSKLKARASKSAAERAAGRIPALGDRDDRYQDRQAADRDRGGADDQG